MARGLKRGRTRLIGILLADLQNPYSVAVMQGIEAACRQAGLMPMLCNAANEIDLQSRYLDLLRMYRAEGLIVNPVGLPESALLQIGAGGMPLVLLDRTVDGVNCDSVGLDNERAARQMVDHLVDNGFETLFFVSESFASVSSRREREAAFVAQAQQRGVTPHTLVIDLADPASIATVLATVAIAATMATVNTAATMATTATAATAATTSARRVALLAANGQTMLPIAIALGAHPQPGLGLATFDDPEWLQLAGPGITSLRQPTFDIGVSAVQLLGARIDGHDAPAHRRTFDAELIPRKSTRALEADACINRHPAG
ncbi:MAG: substrate-binding domain-containing protein, partial [Janthinobacterium lividum]